MKYLKYLKQLALICVVLIGQLFFSYLLPSPYNHVNLIIFLILWTCLEKYSSSLFFLIFYAFLLELMSSGMFANIIGPVYLTFIIMHWFLKNIFSNHFGLSIFFSSLVAQIIYRLLNALMLLINGQTKLLSFEFLIDLAWESFFTTIIIGIIFLAIGRLGRKKTFTRFVGADFSLKP
ncbi:MAG: hypothetical protein COU31_00815 [Candidatus Magasanikbacteria bacterium CG10_big_fil_rev_8_21_14_0_10_40_10]|uniref:Rod shape-determining protein MreD n=1 Tax=Candidatus Magasanikbacteria bacterium CG10_big_fil_rev_8_21_14_0_10_40_10 TaxID=1974648 RepID=A0A2M6W4Z4_9BACT|nr:MAG: hypothetical protein COU31_00815 [Candidatus Magasanikbacteria bacterium CG10_big_fil_rev_8_21_14_0_10_40_10]